MNQLERVCLAKIFKGTGRIVLTDFGEFFMDHIETHEEIVRDHVVDIAKRHV